MMSAVAPGAEPVILVVGSVNRDVSISVERLPAPGETVLAGDVEESLGGKGANQAVAAARMGAHVALAGAVGDDHFGQAARGMLETYGVDVAALFTAHKTTTGTAFVMVDARGENSILVSSAANASFTPELTEPALAGITAADIVLCQGELPSSAVDTAAHIAEAAGARFVLNLAPVLDVRPSTIARADPLILNQGEAAELAHRLGVLAPPDDAARLAEILSTEVARSVVISLGADGAVSCERGSRAHHQPGLPSTVVDTTGAGDCLVGVVVAALLRGSGLRNAVVEGVAAASLSIARRGAAASYPSADSVRSLLDRQGRA